MKEFPGIEFSWCFGARSVVSRVAAPKVPWVISEYVFFLCVEKAYAINVRRSLPQQK